MHGIHVLPHVTTHNVVANIGAYSYLAVFVLTLLAGHLIPLPEEIILLVIGYSAGIGIINFWFAIPIAITGLFTGDVVLYTIGHHGGKLAERLEHRLPRQSMQRYALQLNTRPVATIVAMRFISGIRFFSPIFAGAWRIPFRTFMLADISALAVYVTLYLALGFFFHNALEVLVGGVATLQHVIFLAILLIVGIVIAIHAYRIFFPTAEQITGANPLLDNK